MKLTKSKLKRIIEETIEEAQKEFYVNYLDMTDFSADNPKGAEKSDGPFPSHVGADAHLRRLQKEKDIREPEIDFAPRRPRQYRPDSLHQRGEREPRRGSSR